MPPYNHPVYKKFSLLRLYSFDPSINPQSHFVILKTLLMWVTTFLLRPGFYGPMVIVLWSATVISVSNNYNIRQMMNEKKK